MKAVAVTPGVKNTLRIIETEEPEPGENEVLLKVLKIGICGTDIDIISGFYGEAPEGSDFLVLGHESLCRIAESKKGFKKGELVVPTVRRACKENCLNCRNNQSDMCLTGNYKEHGIKMLHGFASEFAVSDYRYVVKLPEFLHGVGVLLEPLSIVEKAVKQAFTIQKSRMLWQPKKAIVLGTGAIGLLATLILRLKGLEVDTVGRKSAESNKARIVDMAGARYISTSEKNLSELGQKYDIVIEATGSAEIAIEAQNLCGKNGIASYVGIYRSKVESEDAGSVFTNLVLGNKVYLGSVNANISYFVEGINDLIETKKKFGKIAEKIITSSYSLSNAVDAYTVAKEEDIKRVITFNSV